MSNPAPNTVGLTRPYMTRSSTNTNLDAGELHRAARSSCPSLDRGYPLLRRSTISRSASDREMSFLDIALRFLDLLGVLLGMRTSVGFCNGRWSHSARERLLHDEATHAANPARGARDKNGMRHRSALPASHRQHDPEACLAAHHAVVGLGGPIQGVHFVHRTNTGLDAERQRVLRVDGCAGVPALDRPAAPDEQERGGLQ